MHVTIYGSPNSTLSQIQLEACTCVIGIHSGTAHGCKLRRPLRASLGTYLQIISLRGAAPACVAHAQLCVTERLTRDAALWSP